MIRFTREEVAALYNGEIPEVEQVYKDITLKMFDYHPQLTPRFYKEVFSLKEAEYVNLTPATAAQIAEQTGDPKDEIEKTLFQLAHKGLILKDGDVYSVILYGGAFNDLMCATPRNLYSVSLRAARLNHIIGAATGEEHVSKITLPMGENFGAMNRVIPKWQAIKNIPGVMPCEDIREILKTYVDQLSVSRCVCRTMEEYVVSGKLGAVEPCYPGNVSEGTMIGDGNCMHLADSGDYFADVIGAERMTYESAMEKTEYLAKTNSYHMGPNSRDVRFLCNCCSCCCVVSYITPPGHKKQEILSPSRFKPLNVKRDLDCGSCRICMNDCPFDAIRIKNGKAVVNWTKCYGCGNCVIHCPEQKFKMKIVKDVDWIPEYGPQMIDQEITEVMPMYDEVTDNFADKLPIDEGYEERAVCSVPEVDEVMQSIYHRMLENEQKLADMGHDFVLGYDLRSDHGKVYSFIVKEGHTEFVVTEHLLEKYDLQYSGKWENVYRACSGNFSMLVAIPVGMVRRQGDRRLEMFLNPMIAM